MRVTTCEVLCQNPLLFIAFPPQTHNLSNPLWNFDRLSMKPTFKSTFLQLLTETWRCVKALCQQVFESWMLFRRPLGTEWEGLCSMSVIDTSAARREQLTTLEHFPDWSGNNNFSQKHQRIPVKYPLCPSRLREPPLVWFSAKGRVCKILSSHGGSFFFFLAYQQ